MRSDHFLDECPGRPECINNAHLKALEDRAAGAPAWSPLNRLTKGGDFRDYLDGKPIHCGAMLELQGIERRSDDYGEFSIKLHNGALVRYELAWGGEQQERAVVLHGRIAGHEFTARADAWMRFRWPAPRKATP